MGYSTGNKGRMNTHLQDKHILLGISGGIAAYKAAELVRLLKQAGAQVRVVMTEGAKAFITPMTLQALSGYPVHDDLWDLQAEAAMGHIELAKWADLIVIAPASADILAKLAHGLADDLLSTLVLASAAPLVVAPAMNQQMWCAKATLDNVALLRTRGVHLLQPAIGEQACGDVGPGRMQEPTAIVVALAGLMGPQLLAGKTVVITAGPTQEPLDPVRFLTNHSSGKMGYALAQAALAAGASVTLISGPTALAMPAGIRGIGVDTAEEMLAATIKAMPCDIFIAAAAVADYRPAAVAEHKVPKQGDTLTLTLVKNPDILATIADSSPRPYCVGFSAQTEDLQAKASAKREHKGADLMIANLVGKSLGFHVDDNQVTLITKQGEEALPLMPKTVLARVLMERIAALIP